MLTLESTNEDCSSLPAVTAPVDLVSTRLNSAAARVDPMRVSIRESPAMGSGPMFHATLQISLIFRHYSCETKTS